MNPYQATEDFENAIAEYTGAPYVVAVNSCTNALLLACAMFNDDPDKITIPSRTYVGVPMSIINAGNEVRFVDTEWSGEYRLWPLPVWDSARRFTSGMYREGMMQCVSFHASKILGVEAGGAILLDDPDADKWLRKARFDGRTQGVSAHEDEFIRGWHCLMNPSTAAQGLLKLYSLPKHNPDLPNDDYADLSTKEIFK